jgi:zinc/manganese transport system substrate-binding protein
MTLGLLLSVQPAWATLNVFACEPEWAALVQTIGGDRVAVYAATTGKQDPHHIQARPSLIAQTRRADLLLCTGAGLEQGWLPLLLRKAGNPRILAGRPGHLLASEYVPLLDKPEVLDRSLGDVHAAGNPHIHLDPHNILQVAQVLTQRLAELDPEQAGFYQSALADFSGTWSAAMARWEHQAQALQGRSFAVNHKSWVYLAHWLKLDMDTTLEPYPGVPPTAEQLSRLIQQVQRKKIAKIIYSAHSNPRAAHWLAEKTAIPAVELPYTVGGNERADDLYRLFDETLRLLKE